MKARLPQGMGGGTPQNMNQLMKQAQKMQEDMAKIQEEIDATEFSATSGGGAVTAVVQGQKTVKSITLSPDIVDKDDVEMLEDLIVAAVNEALRIADETASNKMGQASGGMNVPGLF